MLNWSHTAFNVDQLCPDCGNKTLFGYQFLDQHGKHMHTYYVCTFWSSKTPGGISDRGRCGWHDWSVPDPDPIEVPPDQLKHLLDVLRQGQESRSENDSTKIVSAAWLDDLERAARAVVAPVDTSLPK